MAVLNDITVKRARPRANKYEITCEAVRGFVLRVLPSGRKIYFARHRPGGRDVRVRIGEADRITCNQARARAMEIIDDVVVTPRAAMRPAAQRVAAAMPIGDERVRRGLLVVTPDADAARDLLRAEQARIDDDLREALAMAKPDAPREAAPRVRFSSPTSRTPRGCRSRTSTRRRRWARAAPSRTTTSTATPTCS